MKRLDFKRGVKIRWKIITSCTMFGLRESLAYTLDNWGGLLSMATYMITYLIFLGVLFGRVNLIAGYNHSEMLFFTLITQINFYMTYVFSLISIERMGDSVNTGTLDLWLVKPVPALWYVTFQRIKLGDLLFSAFPATIPLLIMLFPRWSGFQMNWVGIVSGILLIIIGQVIIHCFQFMMSLTAFFTGEAKNARNMSLELSIFGDTIPFEGYPNFVKAIGLTAIPFMVHTALAVSFFLGKSTNYFMLVYAFGLMVVFLWGKIVLWKFALRHYSSASS
ncbi:MAG TPA: ABC-2 family transporter protein [Spirochaetia bacterium]|nr:ABC-2 family transporter protein [Spirochaetia bacterium]